MLLVMSILPALRMNFRNLQTIMNIFSKLPNPNKKSSTATIITLKYPWINPLTTTLNQTTPLKDHLQTTPRPSWQQNPFPISLINLLSKVSSMKSFQKRFRKISKPVDSTKKNTKMITIINKKSLNFSMKKETLNIKLTGLIWKRKTLK